MIRIFKDCNLEYTECERIGFNTLLGRNEFKFYKAKKEQVYVCTNSKNKSIQYFDFTDGVNARWKRKTKVKIFGGEEIDEISFIADWETYKTEMGIIIKGENSIPINRIKSKTQIK